MPTDEPEDIPPEEYLPPDVEIPPEVQPLLGDLGFWQDLRSKLEANNKEIWAAVWLAGVLAAWQSGEKRVAKASDIPWDHDPVGASAYFGERGPEFVRVMSDTDIKRLRKIVIKQIGLDEKAFKKYVERSYICSNGRLKSIYGNEMHGAREAAAYLYALKHEHTYKQWITRGDAKVRPGHRKLEGQIREIGQPFENGLMYPGTENQCRCRGNYFKSNPHANARLVAPFAQPKALA